MEQINLAYDLIIKFIPEYAGLEIVDLTNYVGHNYIIKGVYTSKKSGKQIYISAKANELPTTNECAQFYARQISLSIDEMKVEFSRVYFYDRRARQEGFLKENSNIRVKNDELHKDKLSAKDAENFESLATYKTTNPGLYV